MFKRGRSLVVVADDFGIGPETSRGIIELAQEGRVTASVLLVNSPHAPQAVRLWHRTQCPMELGWHANLTLDVPVMPAARVPSLVGRDGRFWPLSEFLRRCAADRLRREDIHAELAAQWQRFVELVGFPPSLVNAHHHVAVFEPIGSILLRLLRRQMPPPYLRRVQEDPYALLRVAGARPKRLLLSYFGRNLARRSRQERFPGCDCLAGIRSADDRLADDFFVRCLAGVRASNVELMCHPGYRDPSLLGRDEDATDVHVARREQELQLLRSDTFAAACRDLRFELKPPSRLGRSDQRAA